MIVFNGEAVDFADLFSGKYWLHVGMISKEKAATPPTACLPLHQPSVFPGYLIYRINTPGSPEKFIKIFKQQIFADKR